MPVDSAQKPRVAMVQDGARRRYMVPLALQQVGILDRVYIDWLIRPASIESCIAGIVSKFRPQLGKRMSERICPALDSNKVVSNWILAVRLQMQMRKFSIPEDSYLHGSRRTARWILKEGFGSANILYGFIRNASPELFQAAREQGLRTCADQIIAPYQVEVDEMVEQQRRWPGWSVSETTELRADYLKFEMETWAHLDQITCMSDYVRQGLISVGVPENKITVIRYPWIDAGGQPAPRDRHARPLTVGFVGSVGLRKGSPYFLEVARRFDPGHVKFVMVGKVLLAQEHLGPYQHHVHFTGNVARSQVNAWLQKFDVLFFPSTCEGSAGAVMEGMAAGLAVLTTPNSGSVVRHGVDGFVYRYDEIDCFEEAIRKLDADRDLLHKMGASGRARIMAYNLESYGADLTELFDVLLDPKRPGQCS